MRRARKWWRSLQQMERVLYSVLPTAGVVGLILGLWLDQTSFWANHSFALELSAGAVSFCFAVPIAALVIERFSSFGAERSERRRAANAVLAATTDLANSIREAYLADPESVPLRIDDLTGIAQLSVDAVELVGPMIERGRRWTVGEQITTEDGEAIDPTARLAKLAGDRDGRELGRSVSLLIDHALPSLFGASARISVANDAAALRTAWENLTQLDLTTPQDFAMSVDDADEGTDIRTFDVSKFYVFLGELLHHCSTAKRHALDEFVPAELTKEEEQIERAVAALNRKWG